MPCREELMSSNKEAVSDQPERRSNPDLCGQYRPIGIGAVAAALSATRKQSETAPGAANRNEQTFGERESIAA
jgi:hypothetical protein